MKMLSGVLSGLLIGAAAIFAVLAVLAIVAVGDTCAEEAPASWALRLDVPAARLRETVPTEPLAVGSGSYTISSLAVTECGGLLAVGSWARPEGLRLDNVGIELSLDVSDGALSLRPSKLWFGRLPLDLGWVSARWWKVLLADTDSQVNSLVAEELADSGLEVCGASGSGDHVSLYLCEDVPGGG